MGHGNVFTRTLIILTLVACLFIAGHVGFELADAGVIDVPALRSPQWSLQHEGSYGNFFQSAVQLLSAFIFLLLFLRSDEQGYLGWAFLFSYLFIDDVATIHERMAEYLATLGDWPPLFTIPPAEYLQLVYLLLVGTLLLIPILFRFSRGDDHTRRIFFHLILGMVALTVFAGLLDQLDRTNFSYSMNGLTSLLITLEEGGELLVFTSLFAYILHTMVHLEPPLDLVPVRVWRVINTRFS